MVKPKSQVIEEMETHPIDKMVSPWLIFGSEENARGKDALEAFDDAAVMMAILGQTEDHRAVRVRQRTQYSGAAD